MEVFDKMKFIRSLKGWTQADIAEKLDITTQAYAKIERGETDIHLSRLQQIVKVMDIDLAQLFSLDDKKILNLACSNFNTNLLSLNHCHISPEPTELESKLAQQEILYLKEEVINLKEIIELMKKS